jgi:hypothetical protein
MQASIPEMIEQAKAAMAKHCPDCSADFFTEWGKRFTARLKIDDCVDVIVRAYEKRFTQDELTEFAAVVSSQKTDKPIALSPELKKKLTDILPAIMGEISGATTEIGARLGGEIGGEIEKEHPEYLRPKAKPDKL